MLNNYSSKIIINTDHLPRYLTLQSLHKLYQLNKDFVASSKNNWNWKLAFYKIKKKDETLFISENPIIQTFFTLMSFNIC